MSEDNIFYVNRPGAFVYNLLNEPSDELLYGWTLHVVGGEQQGRVFCKTNYGYSGYVERAALSPMEQKTMTHRVCSRFCDILPEARYLKEPLATLPMGAEVSAQRVDQRFFKAQYQGKTVYLPAVHLQPIPQKTRATPAKIVSTAKKYLGTPYRWAGKSTSGIDCSGLCFMAYYLNGIKIYRDARFPFYSEYEVSPENLRPADLVFFKGHMALYLGGGRILHANAHDGRVTASKLDYNHIVGCASLYSLFDTKGD